MRATVSRVAVVPRARLHARCSSNGNDRVKASGKSPKSGKAATRRASIKGAARDCGAADAPCFPEEHDCAVRDADGFTTYRDDLDAMIGMLPSDVREVLMCHPHRASLVEVILDLGRCPVARFVGDAVPDECLRAAPVTTEDLRKAEASVGDFGGDNRAGIEGTLHRISCIRNRAGKIVGLTCRVGRAVNGHVDMIQDLLGSSESCLFLGRPGVGKTTVIREMARVLSDELGKRVVIIDTSNEIGGDGDVPHPAIGGARRMQVPEPSAQHKVMIEAVENHMPEVIIVDEIGTEAEALACRTIAERGVQLVGTAHGQLLENLIQNPTLKDLVGGIQSVTLGDDEARARGCQKTIMERAGPATFPIVIEMHERSFWVAHNVEESVDEILTGGRPMVQTRARKDGEVVVHRAVYDADLALARHAVAHTLGSMGGIMGSTTTTTAAEAIASVTESTSEPSLDERVFGFGAGLGAATTPATATPAFARNNVVSDARSRRRASASAAAAAAVASRDDDDPYAWARELGRIPDKDALAAMGASGYASDDRSFNGNGNGGADKRGNGKKEKKNRLRSAR